MNGKSGAEVVASNFVAIAYHDPERVCGLSTKAQGMDKTLLQKIVHAPAIDEYDDGVVRNPTQ